MGRYKNTVKNGQCSLIHRRGFGKPQLRNAQRGEIVQGDRYIGMPRAEELLFELKSSLVQLLRLIRSSPRRSSSAEVVQIHRDFLVFRSIPPLKNRERPPIEWFRFIMLTLTIKDRG